MLRREDKTENQKGEKNEKDHFFCCIVICVYDLG